MWCAFASLWCELIDLFGTACWSFLHQWKLGLSIGLRKGQAMPGRREAKTSTDQGWLVWSTHYRGKSVALRATREADKQLEGARGGGAEAWEGGQGRRQKGGGEERRQDGHWPEGGKWEKREWGRGGEAAARGRGEGGATRCDFWGRGTQAGQGGSEGNLQKGGGEFALGTEGVASASRPLPITPPVSVSPGSFGESRWGGQNNGTRLGPGAAETLELPRGERFGANPCPSSRKAREPIRLPPARRESPGSNRPVRCAGLWAVECWWGGSTRKTAGHRPGPVGASTVEVSGEMPVVWPASCVGGACVDTGMLKVYPKPVGSREAPSPARLVCRAGAGSPLVVDPPFAPSVGLPGCGRPSRGECTRWGVEAVSGVEPGTTVPSSGRESRCETGPGTWARGPPFQGGSQGRNSRDGSMDWDRAISGRTTPRGIWAQGSPPEGELIGRTPEWACATCECVVPWRTSAFRLHPGRNPRQNCEQPPLSARRGSEAAVSVGEPGDGGRG
jgi:hypothetical protein